MKSEKKIKEKIRELIVEKNKYSSVTNPTTKSKINREIKILEWVLED